MDLMTRSDSAQLVNSNRIFFLISEDEQVCRWGPNFNQSSFVVEPFGSQPALQPYMLLAKLPRVCEDLCGTKLCPEVITDYSQVGRSFFFFFFASS